MARAKWDKIAEKQFLALDKEWQDDWGTLRARVNNNQKS